MHGIVLFQMETYDRELVLSATRENSHDNENMIRGRIASPREISNRKYQTRK